MTATLTIKAEAAGAVSVLEGVNRLIDGAVKASERCAAVSATISGHWRRAADEVSSFTRQVKAATAETIALSSAAKGVGSNIQSSVAAAQQLTRDLREAANAAASVRVAAAGGSSSSAAYPLARRGGSGLATTGGRSMFGGDFIDVPFSVNGGGGGRSGGGSGGGGISPAAAIAAGAGGGPLGIAAGAVGAAAGYVKDAIGSALEMAWNGFKKGAIAASVAASAVVGNSIRLAIKAEPIAGGFAALTASKGLGDEVRVLEDLRRAARGTVSDLQLMTNANAALQLGAATSTAELETLVEGGRRLGKAMGRDATEGFNDLAIGIGRQSRLVLDNLGIIVKADDEYEKYAESVGTTADALSETEKKLVFQRAALEAVRQKMADLGKEQDTAGDAIGRFKAQFSNLSVELGNRFLPAITRVLNHWTTFIEAVDKGGVGSKISTAFDEARKGAQSILDFLLPTDFTASAAAAGAAMWHAFTDPSKEAFEIVGLRFKEMWVTAKADFLEFWEDVKAMPGRKLVAAQRWGATKFPEWMGIRERAESNSTKIEGRVSAAKEGIRGGADKEIQKIEAQIEKLKADELLSKLKRETASALSMVDRMSSSLGSAFGWNAHSSGGPSTDARLADATAERQAKEATANAERTAQDEAIRILRDETRAREDLLSKIDDERRALQSKIDELSSARVNATAALRGESDPGVTLVARMNEVSTELRRFPGIFEGIGVKLKENGEAMADALAKWNKDLRGAFDEMNASLHRQAQSFLQEGPQDGESVRVRSLKRRAQKEQRNYNNDLINGAFRSPSLDSIGGGLGGFGSQGIERAPQVLDQKFPALERALLSIRDKDGGSQIMAFQERIADLVTAHAEKLRAQREAQAKLLADTAAAHQKQIDATEELTGLVKKSAEEIGQLAAAVSRTQRESAAISKELEKAAQTIRSLK